MNCDRVYELYNGDLADLATQRCRDRIHWICAQAEGQRVLDIGCSQGVSCLILAREGFECTGVDLESASLEFAREARLAEEESVQRRIDFRVANALHLPFADASFDTVILGEILEHLTQPGKAIEEARRVLKEGGKAIITVPYGLKPHPDHKQVYYPGSFLDTVEPYFRTTAVDTVDHYITYCGEKDSSISAEWIRAIDAGGRPDHRHQMLRSVEQRCLAKELSLYEMNSQLHRQVRALTETMEELGGTVRQRDETIREKALEIEALRASGIADKETVEARWREELDAQRASFERTLSEKEAQLRTRVAEAERRANDRHAEQDAAHRAALAESRRSIEEVRARHAAALAAKDREQAILLALQEEVWRKAVDSRQETDSRRRSGEDSVIASELRQLSQRLKALQERTERRIKAEDREQKSDREEERQLIAERIREVVATAIPEGSTVLVVSRGDDELLRLDGRRGLHFPQGPDGVYAGYHPANDADAIALLESLRAKGAEYLLVPSSAYWWLDHYPDFRRHLESRQLPIEFQQRACLIFALRQEEGSGSDSPPVSLEAPPAKSPPSRLIGAGVHIATGPSGNGGGEVAVLAPHGNGGNGGNGKAAVISGLGLVDATAPAGATIARPAAIAQHAAIPQSAPIGRPTTIGHAAPATAAIPIAAVLDEFTTDCLSPECRLITCRPDNWRQVMEREAPRAVFVESAWRGNGGSWQYRVAKYPNNVGDELDHLLAWAGERRVPSVFWNKEDPVHFDRFIGRASLFEYVFTTDANCVPAYRERLGHDRVFPLPFAAQPAIHNPVLSAPRDGIVCFAGTYYGDRHEARRSDMDHILRPALDFGLDIYDRQHGLAGKQAEHYRFPDIYQPCIRGRLDYDEMVKAYKRYRVFLNVNSVKDSSTMFSRRVFELLASGTPVISTYSRGIAEMLGEDLVFFAETEAETRGHLERLLSDQDAWERVSLRGIRKVMTEHTYAERMRYVLERLGIELPPSRLPRLGIVASVSADGDLERLSSVLEAQVHRDLDLVVFAEEPLAEEDAGRLRKAVGGGTVTRISPLGGELLDACLRASPAEYFAFLDLRDVYGAHYLQDVALAAMYSGAALLGKNAYSRLVGNRHAETLLEGLQYRYVSSVPAGTLATRRDSLSNRLLGDCLAGRTIRRGDAEILSIDRFNYLQDGAELEDAWTSRRLAARVEV